MSVLPLLHVAVRTEYEAAAHASHYAPAAFADEGFVHLCRPDQLAGVLGRYFRDRDDLVLLLLDAEALDARLVEEDTTGRGEAFPHLYGPVPMAAVRSARAFRTDAGGGLIPVAADAPGGSPDPEALAQAAFVLAEQYRDGVHAQLDSLTDPATYAWLRAELERRRPGSEGAAYDAALSEAFAASR